MRSMDIEAIEVKRANISPNKVWRFFNSINDVANLNPAEEQCEAWEAVNNDKRIAMAVVDTFGKTRIARIAVKKNFRNKGIGKKLLNKIVKQYHDCFCRIKKTNDISIKLVESVGFTNEGEGKYGELLKYKY